MTAVSSPIFSSVQLKFPGVSTKDMTWNGISVDCLFGLQIGVWDFGAMHHGEPEGRTSYHD